MASTLLTLVRAVRPGLPGQYAGHNRLSAAALTVNAIGSKSQINTLLPFGLRAVATCVALPLPPVRLGI